jgi:hypothetical protein
MIVGDCSVGSFSWLSVEHHDEVITFTLQSQTVNKPADQERLA